MSFYLIIVDDEDTALYGLSEYVNWEEMGYEVSGTAHTIEEAIELVKKKPVDVVLTDIQLEDESGLDLVRCLSTEYPHIRSVILSGHEEFEYAQQAIRHGAFDFLTKPVQFDALRYTFAQLRKQLQRDSQNVFMKIEYAELKRDRFFNNLAKNPHSSFDSRAACELEIATTGLLYLARFHLKNIGMDIAGIERDKRRLRIAIEEELNSYVKYEIFSNSINEYALLFYNCQESEIKAALAKIREPLQLRINIGVSREFHSLSDLSSAYLEAGKALDYCLPQKDNSIIFYADDIIQSIKSFIREHYVDNISLQTLANQFFLHPNYLSQLFTKKTGQNYIDYLTKVRIEKAQELLLDAKLHICDISQMVGYESPKYFSKVFKEITGYTPKEYRNKHK